MARKAPDQDAGEALRRFKSDLKAGTLGNFYIISGEEAFLRSHYVDLVTKKLADGPAGEFNCHRFSADDCTLEVYGRHAWVIRGRAPVMSTSRLIVPLGLLDTIKIAPDPQYVETMRATLGSGAAHVDVLLPEGSDAHLLLERAAHSG